MMLTPPPHPPLRRTRQEADDTEGEHAKTLAAAVAAIPELHDLNPQAVLKSAAAEGIDVGPEVDVGKRSLAG